MTQNAIAYLSMRETERSNLAREKETNRSNLAREAETNRSNLANEKNVKEYNRILNNHYERQDYETRRANLEREDLAKRQQSEVERSNRVVQAETNRLNTANIINNAEQLSINRFIAVTSEATNRQNSYSNLISAQSNKKQADIALIRANTEETRVNNDYLLGIANHAVAQQDADTRRRQQQAQQARWSVQSANESRMLPSQILNYSSSAYSNYAAGNKANVEAALAPIDTTVSVIKLWKGKR